MPELTLNDLKPVARIFGLSVEELFEIAARNEEAITARKDRLWANRGVIGRVRHA